MKNFKLYIFGFVWIFLLIYIGRSGDELLLWLMDYFDLNQVPQIDVYVGILSAVMLVGGCLLILSIRNRKTTNKDIFLRILIGSVIGGFGSVWLSETLFHQWLERCCN